MAKMSVKVAVFAAHQTCTAQEGARMHEELQACIRGLAKAAEMMLSALMINSLFLTLTLVAGVLLS